MNEINTWKAVANILEFHGKSMKFIPNKIGINEFEYNKFEKRIQTSILNNGWFVEKNIRASLLEISKWIHGIEFDSLFNKYNKPENSATKIAIIMAGNVPLVGFHDFMCSLISGYSVVCKMSSDDNQLLYGIYEYLEYFDLEISKRIEFSEFKLPEFDAIIATGSDTSNEAFKNYFGNKKHLFRGNRTSIAVLDGTESDEQLNSLGEDIFHYFGKGCRNITHLCLPKGYDIQRIFKNITNYSDVLYNKKYGNNYDYNKAILLMNLEKFYDNNFVIFRESFDLFSPISVVHYHFYETETELDHFIEKNNSKIQCVVSNKNIPFGNSQRPGITDFADGVNTLEWLKNLSNEAE